MKSFCVLSLLAGAGATSSNGATVAGQTPISRVVELMKGIADTAEKEGKTEEKLYKEYVCWATTVMDTKTATNEVANKRIEELETYIADIEAGRIEFTTERVDLEKELGEINAAIEAADALRAKENKEFLAAEEEMSQAVHAVDNALMVLKEATAGHESGVLLQAKSGLTYSERKAETASLLKAAEMGDRVLSKGDALFLRRLLSGDVPKADWKKLNRKATFGSSYKARSGKIQDLLAKLLGDIDRNLADAQAKEEKDQVTYEGLMDAKHGEKEQCEEALNSMESETGARAATKEESQAEVDALIQQVDNDMKFIEQTKNSYADMKQSFKDRKELRAGEIAAISKAIEILYNDDARDNQKKSFKSQGYSLLQVDQKTVVNRQRLMSASSVLSDSDRSGRLQALSGLVAMNGNSHFTEVIDAIDKMVEVLKEEEHTDLETKETCEHDRAQSTRMAAVMSRDMDELTEANNKLEAEIAEIKQTIVEKKEAIAATEKALAEATTNRDREHVDWNTNDRDDHLAAETVESARHVLESFYTDNGLMLVQQPNVVAGEAPPPPPATWDAPYGGKTAESTSILSILEMIIEDIHKDIEKAAAAEDKAEAAFQTFAAESDEQIHALNEDVFTLEGTQADKESNHNMNVQDRDSVHEELKAEMQMIADAKPGCDFFTINYPSRVKNRHIEIDGLDKAKAILTGGTFNAVDENREIKPGDAFLARRQ